MPNLASVIASLGSTRVHGDFFRYTSVHSTLTTVNTAGGRWHPPNSFQAVYFADGRESAISEAYRRIVNAFDPPLPPAGVTLRLWRLGIDANEVLDLRQRDAWQKLGLTLDDLRSPLRHYEACQLVGKTAHQLGLQGIIAPAATGIGNHLSLFDEHAKPQAQPKVISDEILNGLPPDPRRLRLVGDDEADAG